MGPFDAVASRYGLACQNADRIALTKPDVLSGMDQIPVITAIQKERFPPAGRPLFLVLRGQMMP